MLIDFEDRPHMAQIKFSLKVLWMVTSLLSPIVTMLPALVFFQV